jgi:hypothetical protein
MEHAIYMRGVTKESTARRVLDKDMIGNYFAKDELVQLYAYAPNVENKFALAVDDIQVRII